VLVVASREDGGATTYRAFGARGRVRVSGLRVEIRVQQLSPLLLISATVWGVALLLRLPDKWVIPFVVIRTNGVQTFGPFLSSRHATISGLCNCGAAGWDVRWRMCL